MTVSAFAPAKINLTLHVTGKCADGKHLLDSLVGFAGVGDVVTLRSAKPSGMTVSGPESTGVPTDGSNLVAKVAAAFWQAAPMQIHLEKSLPAASGIGGGSADAAACFRAIRQMNGMKANRRNMERLLALGADIPMCVQSVPARIGGIGEQIEPLKTLPAFCVLLVNPRVEVSTAAVFNALNKRDNAPMSNLPQDLSDYSAVIEWLRDQRNDLQSAAISIAPEISQVLDGISATQGCLLARMSGSGATCFGLFDTIQQTEAAGKTLREAHPDWWIVATQLNGAELIGPDPN